MIGRFLANDMPGYEKEVQFATGYAIQGTPRRPDGWLVVGFTADGHPFVTELENIYTWELGGWVSSRPDDFTIVRPEPEPVDVCEWEDC